MKKIIALTTELHKKEKQLAESVLRTSVLKTKIKIIKKKIGETTPIRKKL